MNMRFLSALIFTCAAGLACAQTSMRIVAANISSGNFQQYEAPGKADRKSVV